MTNTTDTGFLMRVALHVFPYLCVGGQSSAQYTMKGAIKTSHTHSMNVPANYHSYCNMSLRKP